MTTSRLETFADGVFAIAATLLILNVDAQIGAAPADLGAGLLHMWPSYVAYAVSFLPGPFIYLAATLIALVSPTASVVLYGVIALFYVVESSLFGGSRGPGARSG